MVRDIATVSRSAGKVSHQKMSVPMTSARASENLSCPRTLCQMFLLQQREQLKNHTYDAYKTVKKKVICQVVE